ncbi:MAG: hypothetical protein KME64_12180 [Scytonematopsis contorta HA4267-MV1]|jgi:hypothetical protein|nr:hypothetical protein [Scytonematopsis contorta HA4267-MV1]
MKFFDLFNSFSRRSGEASNIINNPEAFVRQQTDKRLTSFLKNLSLDKLFKPIIKTDDVGVDNNFTNQPNLKLDTLDISDKPNELVTTLKTEEKLSDDLDLMRWDIYTIIQLLKSNDNESLYMAQNTNQDKLFIKEYKLPNHKSEKIEQVKRDFKNIVELNLRIGREYDFRILTLIDRFTRDNSCFLVTKYIADSVPLKDYLEPNPVMTNEQIKVVIQQILESLLFLHTTYRAKFKEDKEDKKDKQERDKGISHGNINLNSLLIKYTNEAGIQKERRFFIYLTDLVLWKDIVSFDSVYYTDRNKYNKSIQSGEYLGDKDKRQDLFNLGKLALALIGKKYDEESWKNIESQADNILSNISNIEFSSFIKRLLNKQESFKVDEALDAIIKINVKQDNVKQGNPNKPPEVVSNNQPSQQAPEINEQAPEVRRPNTPLALLTFTSLFILVASAIFGVIYSQKPQLSPPKITSNQDDKNCCWLEKKDFDGIQGKYLAESAWERVSQQPIFDGSPKATNLMNFLNTERGLKSTYFFETRSETRPKTKLQTQLGTKEDKNYKQVQIIKNYSRASILAKLNSDKINFALMRLPVNVRGFGVSALAQSDVVAYDALVIFVAFKYSLNTNDTPSKILDGKISKQEIFELYTNNKIKRLAGKKINIRLYFPEDKETQEVFQDKILALVNTKNTSDLKDIILQLNKMIINSKQFPSNILFQQVRNDSFDKKNKNTIIIGVDRLSRLFGQCSVYPLAIVDDNNQSVQLLKQSNGEDIQPNDKNLDLCNDKGTYFPNVEALSSGKYPLGYKLGIVSKKDNQEQAEKFAQALRKYEVQYLLSQVGLVPLESIPNLRNALSNNQSTDKMKNEK